MSRMLLHYLLPCLLLLAPCALGLKWENFKTTWGGKIGKDHFFEDQPRTQEELEGWLQIGSCDDKESKFPGNRFVRNEGSNDIIYIYDSNGYIAGIQNIVPVAKTEYFTTEYNFTVSPYYQTGTFLGEDVYFTTAYFVEPEIICNGGRSPAEFEEEGTGHMLLFQTGDSPDQNIAAPLTEVEANAHSDWFQHRCSINMGTYWLQNDPANPTEDCDELVPFQLLYNNGRLNGFVFFHLGAHLAGPRWEYSSANQMEYLFPSYPQCAFDMESHDVVTSLHVYLSDYKISCRD